MNVDMGDVPTWVGAIFAAGAAGAAVWTLASQRKQIDEQRAFIGEQSATLALERAELHAAAEDRKWSQARQVRMTYRTAGGQPDGGGGLSGYDHWRVSVENGSDAPLSNVLARFGSAYVASEAYDELERDLPGSGRQVVPVHRIGPHRTFVFVSPPWQETTVDNNRPHVFFTDDAGIRWHLDRYGSLTQHPEGEAE
ncbi:hypothetical protein [Streptomyces sp. NPDC058653]|uniref:hypothetical protein n=1 Tax=Streptomyces sp. NPDC058653 TaxID=3346576 RepID=UPI0036571D4E